MVKLGKLIVFVAVVSLLTSTGCACSPVSSESVSSPAASSSSAFSSSGASGSSANSPSASAASSASAESSASVQAQADESVPAQAQEQVAESAPVAVQGTNIVSTANNSPAHEHTWEPIVEEQTRIIQEAYHVPHVVVYVRNYATGEETGPYETMDEAIAYMDSVLPDRTSYGTVDIGERQPEISTTESVIVGYRCTGCGATK